MSLTLVSEIFFEEGLLPWKHGTLFLSIFRHYNTCRITHALCNFNQCCFYIVRFERGSCHRNKAFMKDFIMHGGCSVSNSFFSLTFAQLLHDIFLEDFEKCVAVGIVISIFASFQQTHG